MLPIGVFSNATQLSAKALRLYAAHGILMPAHVDAESGYRYYRPEQVRDARLVRLLRDLDMPLTDITWLMADRTRTETAIKQQMHVLAKRHARHQTAYQAALALLHSTSETASNPVAECDLPQITTVARSFEANAGNLLARARLLLAGLRSETDEQRHDPCDAFVLLSAPLSGLDEASLELCVHADLSPRAQLVPNSALRVWPAMRAACIKVTVQDDVPDLVSASDALFDWFDRHGHSLSATPRMALHDEMPELIWPIS
jgi:DNA-binding transcriptional MerR regulator